MDQSPPRPPSFAKRALRTLAVLLLFLVLGPPLGALAFFLSIGLVNLGHGVLPEDLVTIGLFALIYGVPLSYMMGAAPAALAGLAIGLWQGFVGRVALPGAIATGAATGVGLTAYSGTQVWPSSTAEAPELVIAGVLVATCLVPTVLCWLVVRNWRVAPDGSSRG